MKKLSKETKIKLALGGLFIVLIGGYGVLKFSGSATSQNGADSTKLGSDPTISDKTQKAEYEVSNKDLTQNMFGGTSSETVVPDTSKKAASDTKTLRGKRKVKPAGTVMATLEEKPQKITVRIERDEPRVTPIPEKHKKKIYFVVVKENDYRSPLLNSKLDEGTNDPKSQVKLFKAKIYGTQKIKTNESLTIRNVEDIVLGNKKIPSGSIFYGITSISGNRMFVSINSAVTQFGSVGLDLSLYDSDYSKGIFLKETMDVQVEQSGDQVIENSLQFASPTAQIAGTIAKESAKQVQRALTRQKKVSVVLEDSYEVMIGVPIKQQL